MTFLLILVGFLAGVIGGMGMGGGTILVPLLSFLDLGQKSVQATNLISFFSSFEKGRFDALLFLFPRNVERV